MIAWLTFPFAPLADAATFTDVTLARGLNYVQGPPVDPLSTSEVIGMTGGAAAGDYDGDGWIDLFVTRTNAPDILYRNEGGTFVDATEDAFGSTPIDATTNGAAWGDIDNDGDLDLYVTVVGEQNHLLYINDGNGQFSEQAALRGASPGGAGETLYGTGIAWGDYDRDGFLDLFVAEWRLPSAAGQIHARLLKNRGAAAPGYFQDVTESAGVMMDAGEGAPSGRSFSFSPRFADLDGDRHPDLAITSDFGTSRLFWNNGAADAVTFTDGTAAAGIDTGLNDMGSAIGDVNGDGRPDWFITDIYRDSNPNEHPNGNRLFRNDGDRSFTDVTSAAGVRNGDWGWGAAMFDYDNDGDLDITMTNGFIDGDQYAGDPMRLWENDGSGVFSEIGAVAGVDDEGQGRGLLTFDFDRDGDLDIFVVNNGQQPVLLENNGGNHNNRLRVTTVGRFSNRDGIGALITVTPDESNPDAFAVWETNAGTHYLAQSEFTAHFGLGPAVETVDRVEILWPSGVQQALRNVPANSELIVVEVSGDFNADGIADGLDREIWAAGFASSGPAITIGDGDADADLDADGRDYLWWQRGYNGEGAADAVAVPEPGGLACAAMLLATAAPSLRFRGEKRGRGSIPATALRVLRKIDPRPLFLSGRCGFATSQR